MQRTLGILLSTAAIGLGAAAGAAPAAANPAIVLPLAAAAGGLAIGGAAAAVSPYPYGYQESYGYEGRTAVAPPAGYPIYVFPPTIAYPQAAYTYPDYSAPAVVYQPVYASACNVVSQRESNGWSAEWRNTTVCY